MLSPDTFRGVLEPLNRGLWSSWNWDIGMIESMRWELSNYEHVIVPANKEHHVTGQFAVESSASEDVKEESVAVGEVIGSDLMLRFSSKEA